jgi:hypothetical protein
MSFFSSPSSADTKPDKKFANISDDAINSIQQDVPVKYLAGRNYVAGDFISPAYDPLAKPVKTQVGKGDSQTTGYIYFCTFVLMCCMGGRRPVRAIRSVISDSEIIWTGNIVRGNAHFETITVDKFGPIKFYWGTDTQPIDPLLQARGDPTGIDPQDPATWHARGAHGSEDTFDGLPSGESDPYSGHYQNHSAMRGQAYAIFGPKWKLGQGRTNVPNMQFELERDCPWFAGGFKPNNDAGVNPIAILFDLITDPRFGPSAFGFPEAKLNRATFDAEYAYWETKGMRLSPVITGLDDFPNQVATLLKYIDGWIVPNNGLIEVGSWHHGGTPAAIATLTDADMLDDPGLEPEGWDNTVNQVTATYKDRDHHFNDYPQTARDNANWRSSGKTLEVTLDAGWINDAALAKQFVKDYAALNSIPSAKGPLVVKRDWVNAHNVLPGRIIELDSSFYGYSFFCRVLKRENDGDESAKSTLTVEVDRSSWPQLYTGTPYPLPGDFQIGPRAIWRSSLVEVPYLMQDHRFVTQIAPLAIRGNAATVGFRIWASFDNGGTYNLLSTTRGWAGFGRTTTNLDTTRDFVYAHLYGVALDDVVTQTPAEQADDNLIAVMGTEFMSVGQVYNYAAGLRYIRLLRGRFGTLPVNHVQPVDVYFIFRSDLHLLDHAQFLPGQQVKFKLQPFTVESDYDLAAITPITFNVLGFGEVPAPTLSPPGGNFVGSVSVTPQVEAGLVVRVNRANAPVRASDPEWPKTGGSYAAIVSTTSFTLRAAAFAPDGRRSVGDVIAIYTKVTSLPAGDAQCSIPRLVSFSGNRGHTPGDLTLASVTAGSTVRFRKNSGGIQNYSGPIHLACTATGDFCEFWAEKSGLAPSPHAYFNNTRIHSGGGGGGGGARPPLYEQ